MTLLLLKVALMVPSASSHDRNDDSSAYQMASLFDIM
jgi:hypothetical protein